MGKVPAAMAGAKLDPSQMSGSDRLMMLGAMLKDVGAGLNHQDGDAIANMQQMLLARQQRAAQNAGFSQLAAMRAPSAPTYADAPAPTVASPTPGAPPPSALPSLGGLPGSSAQPFSLRPQLPQRAAAMPGDLSGGLQSAAPNPPPAMPYQYQFPQRTSNGSPGGPLDLADPKVQSTLEMLGRTGVDTSKLLDIYKAAEPDLENVNGVMVDKHNRAIEGQRIGVNLQNINGFTPDMQDPRNAGRFFGAAPVAGAQPVADVNGNLDWRMAQGATNALAAAKAAEAAGTALGGLPYAQAQAAAVAAGTGAGGAPYKLTAQDVGGVPTTMTEAQAIGLAGSGAQAPGAPTQGAAGAAGPLTGPAMFQAFTGPHEGGFNPRDMNGAPVNMGFNQKANPDIDVSKLTPAQASQRFVDKYWTPSGADHLPPALAAVHADTYFMNPGKATQILAQSGGDPNKYMDLREKWLNSLVASNPNAQKYAQAWTTRNADLRAFSAQYAGQPAAAAPGAPQPTTAPPGIRGLNKADESKLASYMEDARTAEDVVQKAHQFQQLNTKQASGPGYRPFNVSLPFMHQPIDINVPGALARQYQTGVPAMNNLSMQLAAGLRAPGQRLTQQEIMMNLKSVPGLNNTPDQNDALTSDMEQRAATKRAYANFMSDWLRTHGSLQGADPAWAAGQRNSGQAAPKGGGGAPGGLPAAPKVGEMRKGFVFRGGNPADPHSWAPAH